MDRRSLDLVSSDFQRIVAAEVAPKMDLIVETKIACPIRQVYLFAANRSIFAGHVGNR